MERVLTGEVKHYDEPHGPSIVSCGDGLITLLTSCVPDLQLNTLLISEASEGERVERNSSYLITYHAYVGSDINRH